MASLLQTLASLEENEHAGIELHLRVPVGPSDRAAARFLIEFIDLAAERQHTFADGEIALLLKLADTINDAPDNLSFREMIELPELRAAMDALFWFRLLEALHEIKQPPPVDIRSVWVVRPQPYTHGAPLWQTIGIVVTEMIGHDRPMWAIKAGENDVLGKDGEWESQPMPSSRTDDFFARTRWDNFEDALAFAQQYVAKEGSLNVAL